MNDPNSLSLRKTSNKITAVFALILTVVGLAVNHSVLSDAYLFLASLIGVIWGTLRCLGFGERQWQSSVIILLIMLIYGWLFRYSPGQDMRHFAYSLLSFMAFYSIAILWVFLVVWLKEYEENRTARGR